MVIIAALIIGALLGWRRAVALGGGPKDIAQYVMVHALIFALIGLFASILIERLA